MAKSRKPPNSFIGSKPGSLWCFEKPLNECNKRSFGIADIVLFDEIMACKDPDKLKNLFQDDFRIDKEIFIVDIEKPIMSLGKVMRQKETGELYKKVVAATMRGETKICWIHSDDCIGLKEKHQDER